MRSLPRTTPDLLISLLNLGRIAATGCPIHREGPSRDRPVWPCDATVASARDLRRGSLRCVESLAAARIAEASVAAPGPLARSRFHREIGRSGVVRAQNL